MSDKNIFASNRKASRNFQILDKFEAGIVLFGTEVKSIKLGHVSIQEGYIQIDEKMEVWLVGCTIQHYDHGNLNNHKIDRERKLLLHRNEIIQLSTKVKEKGFTLIPLKVYSFKGKIKIQIALSKGKDGVDKREIIKKREFDRESQRVLKNFNGNN